MYIKTSANTLLVSAAVLSAFTVTGQNALTAPTKQQVEQIVKQYILDHPEVVLESVKSFQQAGSQLRNNQRQYQRCLRPADSARRFRSGHAAPFHPA